MDLQEFKNKVISEELEISEDYGRIFSFIDFSNVNRWFENDNQDWNNKLVANDEKLSIDLKKLKIFTDIFSERVRIYYGEDSKNHGSLKFTYVIRKIFGKRNVEIKELQRIKHYIKLEGVDNIKHIFRDKNGRYYAEIRKCNFDVEISVDAIKMLQHYDTFCILSGDADFTYLNNFLRKEGKKVIIIKGGFITAKLRESADIVINAQKIKKYIAQIIKDKDLTKSGLCG